MTRRLFVMGGGGFQMEPENLALDRYFVDLAGVASPRVLLVPTASGDSRDLVTRFESAMTSLRARPSVLSLFRGTRVDIEAFVREHDVIYVTGGNTRNMLTLWREWGVDVMLRRAYDAGVVVGGLSAGSLCWYEGGVTDSWPGTLAPLSGLGWLKGSHCPHYDGEPGRRPAYEAMVADGRLPGGVALDDGAAILYEDEQHVDCVGSRPEARVTWVTQTGGGVRSDVVEPRLLPRMTP